VFLVVIINFINS